MHLILLAALLGATLWLGYLGWAAGSHDDDEE
jgi:hypothetical protein